MTGELNHLFRQCHRYVFGSGDMPYPRMHAASESTVSVVRALYDVYLSILTL